MRNRTFTRVGLWLLPIWSLACAIQAADVRECETLDRSSVHLPYLQTDNRSVQDAFRIAVGDLLGNIMPHQSGLLERPTPVILAGLNYNRPWTRDASINAWNGGSLIVPEIARDTLLSVLMRDNDGVRIGGQYWDAIVWVTGAWEHYLMTGDREFLAVALEAARNSLAYFERTEFDPKVNLFRGAGWSDGIAAYPDVFAVTGGSSAIFDWPKHNPETRAKVGYGIPMQAISTNCLYYSAYRTALKMASVLEVSPDPEWSVRAEKLKKSINKYLWNESSGSYRFFTSPLGDCELQEALGQAYAILFGVADASQTETIFKNQKVTPAGVPCTWPTFARYENEEGTSFGRHSGPVWPQIQGFWADAAARCGKVDLFAHELFRLAEHANRDKQFAEIYHPFTREIYGGMQEAGDRGIILWNATSRQTWAATAYLRMVLRGLLGMRFELDGIRFEPCMPEGLSKIRIQNIRYRGTVLDIAVSGTGTTVKSFCIDGRDMQKPFLSNTETGEKKIEIDLQ